LLTYDNAYLLYAVSLLEHFVVAMKLYLGFLCPIFKYP